MGLVQVGTGRQRRASEKRALCERVTLIVGTFLTVGILISACGNSGGSSAPISYPHRSTTSAATVKPSNSASAAVLRAYRAAWTAFEEALANANPTDPALVATMVNPQLQSVKANLLADQMQGIVGRGPTTLHPKISTLSKTSATVIDCAYSANELIYKATGKAVPPETPPENDGVVTTMVISSGTWKVSQQTVTDGKCADVS